MQDVDQTAVNKQLLAREKSASLNVPELQTIYRRTLRARKAVFVVCMLLIASQIMHLLFGLLGFAIGVIGGLFTLLVSWFATRKAKQGAKSTAWFMLPPVMFTGVPLVLHWLNYRESGIPPLQDFLLLNLPLVFGFFLPVIILLTVYWRLSRLALLLESID